MFDSHCHLNFKAFVDDAHAVAHAMERNRVRGLVVGCDRTTNRYAIDLAQTLPNLWASVGLHPTHVLDDTWDDLLMKELALEDRVIAIGEVGLDKFPTSRAAAVTRYQQGASRVIPRSSESEVGYRFDGHSRMPESNEELESLYWQTQVDVFKSAIDLAKRLEKPLVVHSREAYEEIIEVLTREDVHHGTVHCFMGTWEQAQKILDLGFMIGFTGVITYKTVEPALLEVVKNMPLDRILIETDAPFLTPEPYRTEGKKNSGKIPRNLPQYVLEVAKKIAELRDMKMMEVVALTEENANKLFRIEIS